MAVIFLISCSESEEIITESDASLILEKEQILDATLEQQILYKRHHMKVLAKWVNKHGVEIIKDESKNKNEILISDLVSKAISQKNYNLENEDYSEVQTALDAFVDIGDNSWYPVIRIVNNNFDNKNSDDETILSVEDADLNGEKFTHYLLGENDDDLTEPDFVVTPESTQNYNLIVAEIISAPDPGDGYADGGIGVGNGGGSGGGSGSGGYIKLEIDNMKIKDLKEGWPGRSEIAFKGYKIDVQPNIGYLCGDNIYASVNCSNVDGKRITRLKRRHKNDNRSYDWDVSRNETFSNDVLVYVIFEQDSWPAPEKTSSMPLPLNAIVNIPYRSWNSKYDEKTLSRNNLYNLSSPSNYSVNNSVIEYNLKSFGF